MSIAKTGPIMIFKLIGMNYYICQDTHLLGRDASRAVLVFDIWFSCGLNLTTRYLLMAQKASTRLSDSSKTTRIKGILFHKFQMYTIQWINIYSYIPIKINKNMHIYIFILIQRITLFSNKL